MSTIVRRRRGSRMSLGPYKRHELLGGRIDYPVQGYDGYGDGRSINVADFISAEMSRLASQSRGADGILEIRREPKLFRTACHGFARTLRLAVCHGRAASGLGTAAERAMPVPAVQRWPPRRAIG